jgi:hypothetical protein
MALRRALLVLALSSLGCQGIISGIGTTGQQGGGAGPGGSPGGGPGGGPGGSVGGSSGGSPGSGSTGSNGTASIPGGTSGGAAGVSGGSGNGGTSGGAIGGATGAASSTAGSGSSGGQGSTTGSLFAAASPTSYLDKVKNLLTGLPPTDAELNAVLDGGAPALQGLIAGWIASGPTQAGYQQKMIAFFETAFQQNQVTPGGEFFDQHNGDPQGILLQNFQQSFALTAWHIVQSGQPFTNTANTTSYMMTPALMAEYARIDSLSMPDEGAQLELYQVANPSFQFTVEGETQIPLSDTLDPASPNYMVFYSANLATQTMPGCSADRVYTFGPDGGNPPNKSGGVRGSIPGGQGVVGDLWGFLFVGLPEYVLPDGGDCPVDYYGDNYFQPSDYTTWNLVNVVQPASPFLPDGGLATTLFYDLQTLRNLSTASTPGNLVLNMPRVGYFTTPTFLAQWNTNASNEARVTVNQTLIVGLNHAFDGTDSAVPPLGGCAQFSDGGWACDGGLAALDSDHAAPGSACFACHETMDPMRQYFRQAYSLDFTIQTVPAEIKLPGVFAFDGVSEISKNGIYDLGNQIANHPAFATAWTQKLCTYATSTPCDETDPAFVSVATAFQNSNYDWNTLVEQLFSSPLVTYATYTQTAGERGDTVSIARQAHLCALLSERLNINDVCGLNAATVVPASLRSVQTIAASYPSDQYGRGIVAALLNSSPSLFAFSGLENMCDAISDVVIDATPPGPYSSSTPAEAQAAISDFASNLMGLTSDRSGPVLAVLQGHFADAQADGGVSASNALKSTFILACESVYVGGIGL